LRAYVAGYRLSKHANQCQRELVQYTEISQRAQHTAIVTLYVYQTAGQCGNLQLYLNDLYALSMHLLDEFLAVNFLNILINIYMYSIYISLYTCFFLRISVLFCSNIFEKSEYKYYFILQYFILKKYYKILD